MNLSHVYIVAHRTDNDEMICWMLTWNVSRYTVKSATLGNFGVRELKFDSFGGREDGEHTSPGFEIPTIIATLNEFFDGTAPFGEV